ncbi:sodium/proline symporter PutP [Virgibacillus ihumii]|uniref:sodium/proline symporter PutP n=1 Tax=Virgibacillus ihumii TaxID=2686091 RepID=UPI00157C2792|nr:sodium/proline symporter PutP [Virgibacillus ihumii]
MDALTIITLGIYMAGMLAIGYWSYRKTKTLDGYMLGDRDLGPAVTALSAGASDMSGWMVMGLPGAFYALGMSQVWLPVGLSIGAYINYLVVASRLRVYTEIADNAITVPDYLENRFADKSRILRVISGLFILIFFAVYAASGLVAGGKLFESAFGASYHTGLFVTLAVIVAYTLFGGFLAVSTTDFVQGCIMFVALVLVPIVVFTNIGGDISLAEELRKIGEATDVNMLNIFTGGTFLSILGLLAWGLGYFGQPHIIVRFMAIRDVKEMKIARRINIGWMVVGLAGAGATGILGAVYFANHGGALPDPETVLIDFAAVLFHPIITGFILAAILAAIMSTVSSQLLVTSSAITEDFYRKFFRRDASDKELVLIGRLAVLAVGLIAAWIAFGNNQTVLGIVSHAWAGFGATFGAVILVSLHWKQMTQKGAIAGVVTGGLTVILWLSLGWDAKFPGLNEGIYEIIPGFLLSLLAIYVVSKATTQPDEKIKVKFDEMEQRIKS